MARANRVRHGLLGSAPAFRALWIARSVSFTGDGAARVALVLLAARGGPGQVSLVLLANTLPRLLGPVAGAIVDRTEPRRLMIGCEVGQGAIYAVLAAVTPPTQVLLATVAASGLFATLFSPAGKGAIPRLVPRERLSEANALLGSAFNLQVIVGPAVGGLVVGLLGVRAVFAVNAASFVMSAVLMLRLPRLPSVGERGGGVLSDTRTGLRYTLRTPVTRALFTGTMLIVAFAAIDNVALVFLMRNQIHAPEAAYGLAVGAAGLGMLAASIALTHLASSRPPHVWLLGGVLTGTVGTAVTGLAPNAAVAMAGQFVAGAGNTADLIGSDTLIQNLVPPPMLGRVFGAIGTAAQVGSAAAYAAGAPLVSLIGARGALLISAVGMVAGLSALRPALRPNRTPPPPAAVET